MIDATCYSWLTELERVYKQYGAGGSIPKAIYSNLVKAKLVSGPQSNATITAYGLLKLEEHKEELEAQRKAQQMEIL